MVCLLKQPVGGWWEEKVDLTPCNGATPSESSIREIRTYGSMRGRRSKDLLLLCEVGAAFCNKKGIESEKILKTILGSQELLDLAQRPLLLIMMLDIFIDSQEILEIEWNMAKLYEVYTEKWLKNEAAKPDSVLRWHEKAALMEEIGWAMYQAGAPSSYSYGDKLYQTITFTRTDLIKYLQPHVIQYQHIPFAQIVDDMCLRTFLIGSYGDYYYFLHKSFQEYYVAKHILTSMRYSAENAAQALQVSTPAEVAAFLKDMLGSKHIPKHDKDLIVSDLIVTYQQNNGSDLRSLIIREHASYYLARSGTQKAITTAEGASVMASSGHFSPPEKRKT
jgi:hypothetical protein